MIHKEIAQNEINTDDFPLSFSAAADVSGLAASISETGLLNPPVLFRMPGIERLVVARGARRVRAAVSIGMDPVPARISKETSPLAHLKAGIHENAAERPLTMGEKARALKLLLENGAGKGEIQKGIFPVMGVPPSYSWWEYLEGLAGLSTRMQSAVDRGLLSRQMVLFLAGLPEGSAKMLFDLVIGLKVNLNHQRIAVNLLSDLMDIYGMTPEDILKKSGGDLDKEAEAGRGEGGGRFIKALSLIRNPGLAEMERAFEETVHRMSLPLAASLSHHPTFESRRIGVRMVWRSPREARYIIDKLNRADKEGLIDELFEKS